MVEHGLTWVDGGERGTTWLTWVDGGGRGRIWANVVEHGSLRVDGG